MSVDKYSTYAVFEVMDFVELIFCWAHQRGKFLDARMKHPELDE